MALKYFRNKSLNLLQETNLKRPEFHLCFQLQPTFNVEGLRKLELERNLLIKVRNFKALTF